MSKKGSATIPLLPCISFDDSLAFWQALGYELTYKQRAPNAYAVLRYDDYEINFFDLPKLKPEDNFSTCLVIVSEVEVLHQRFSNRLREALGKVPAKGFPHITRMKPGQTRFTLVDIAGNSVIYIKRGEEDEAAANEYKKANQTPLQKSLSMAARLRDFKNDDVAAAKVLDAALAKPGLEPSLDLARALAARIELATVLEEPERANELQNQFETLTLSKQDRETLVHEMVSRIAQ